MQELRAQIRKELGKKTKTLRRAGFLPAVLYGENVPSQSITVSYKDFERAYREAGESTLLKLELEGKPFNVLIYDIKEDALSGNHLHADFYAVRMDKEIKTKIQIEFLGESPAVKSEGGILVKVLQEIEVEALPQDLPHGLRVDLAGLSAIGARLLVKDILLPKGVRVMADPEKIVVLVEAPRSEEELAALKEKTVPEALTAVETEQELKKAAKTEKEKVEKIEEGGVKK